MKGWGASPIPSQAYASPRHGHGLRATAPAEPQIVTGIVATSHVYATGALLPDDEVSR